MTSVAPSPAPGYTAVDLAPEQRPEILALDAWAFPTSLSDEAMLGLENPLPADRVRGVRTDDGELVAMHASYPFSRFPVPGGSTPVAGLTWVGVHPGHRRRGLLRAMIQEHVTRSLARGESVSALFAAEPAIYGRFGYGLAARDLRLRIPRGAALRDVPGAGDLRIRLERLDPATHGPVVARLHAQGATRPGWAQRETPELAATFLSDPEQFRYGAESLRVALAYRPGDDEPVGYALFRRKDDWQAAGPRGQVHVREVVGSPSAVRALWGVLLDLDLTSVVEVRNLAVDDPLTALLVDLRAAEPRTADNVWVRVLDVPAALEARRWAAPLDVVLEVRDTLRPENAGRWHVRGDLTGSEVTRTQEAAHLTLDVRELGSVYLGGVSLAALAQAGQVESRDDAALVSASAAFSWPLAPVTSWVF